MDRLHSDRCDSVELDPNLRFCLSPPGQSPPYTPNLEVLQNLEKKNQELLDINKKWAERYRTLRQHVKSYELRKEEKEKDTKQTGQEAELRARLQDADREIAWLRMHCDTLTRGGQQLNEEIMRLNTVLQKSLAVQHKRNQREENVWKHQAQVYKEDFFKERKDREMLMAKYTDLEEKFKKVHDELRAYKLQARWAQLGPSTSPPAHT
ncbi:TNFAIP3-interacting protein 1 [Astyanax mexicanus]|uniref:TNFAIP3-interacting protein 1 n=1 Tax=Astyanax mexicanus TaxID=7994 RepID=UPI000440FB8A|nr:TNFAIP3-interacting protein 1 [Astyanax mexicanus]